MYIDLSDTAAGRICLNAAQADSLSCGDVGSATQPIYFADGLPVKTTYTLGASVPSNAKFTDTNTKVTSVGNHYAPSADSAATLSATAANGSAAAWNSTQLVTGVNLQRDAKGHVTGVTVNSVKMPTNPNSNTAHTHTAGVGLSVTGSGGTTGSTTYSLLAAGSTLGGVKTGGDVTISDGVITVNNNSHTHTIANITNLQAELDKKANKNSGIIYIAGTGDTAGTWLGEHDDITEYFDGLVIAYKVPVNGASPTTLKINELDAVTVKLNNNTALTTHYPVNSVLLLTYTTDSGTPYWKISNYDSNTKVTQASTTTNANYHLLMAYSTNIATSTASTTRKNASLYYNPASKILVSPTFSGALTGNASTATAFEEAKDITLSGDITGTSSSTGGWTITTALAATGVASGSYGLSAAVTPAFGSSFNVPYIAVDTKGRITAASTYTVKLPANPNSDTKVTNTLNASAKAYITGTTTSTTSTGTQVFNTAIYYSANTLVAPTFSGALSGKATSAGTADSATKATKDASGNTITSTYETKTDATAKLTEAKTYTDTKVAAIVDTAPEALNTLNELAAALGDDENFATTVATNIGTKANKTITITGTNGLTGGGDLTSNRTISANLVSTTKLTNAASAATETAGRVYPVAMDKNGKLAVNVPWSNTTYEAATTSANGLMTSTMVTKLNGIATGAEVNQNAFSNVKIGTTTIAADGKTDTLELVGSNVTLTSDTTNDKITIGITKANVTTALGYTPPTTNTTYSVVSASTDGLVPKFDGADGTIDSSSNDWVLTDNNGTIGWYKLPANAFKNDNTHYTTGITAGASETTTNSATSNPYIKIKDDSTHRSQIQIKGSGATSVSSDASGVITISSTDNNTIYNAATQSAAGLMSAADKAKLDGIATQANKYTLPTASSSTLGGVKIGSNINISSGVISVPAASGSAAGVTIVYPAASCTTFSSDSGTVTPLAVQKGAELFAITRPPKRNTNNPANPGEPGTCTTNNIVRWLNAAGDVQDSNITIQDVTNTKDTSKKGQVLSIPVEGGKKMVYGYCTDQDDGTSFIGGVFAADATEYPFAQGLAIGGTSGNLLWKGKAVATTDQIPTSLKNPYAITIQGNGTTLTNGVYDGSAAKTVNITASSIGAAPTSHASTGTSYGKGTNNNYGHVKLSDAIDGTAAAASGGTAATPAAVRAAYDASAKVASPNTFIADNTFDENTTTTLEGAIVLGANSYGSTLPEVNNSQGRIFFVEDNTQDVIGLPAFSSGDPNSYLVNDGSSASWRSLIVPTKYNETGERSYLLTKSAELGANDPTVMNYDTNIYSMGGYLYAPKVYGAVWNDYAEYRNQTNIIEPGYCVASKDNGEIYKTTEKFQACDGIVSDTFGFAIGETEKCKTPLAVAGRVLAYCEGNREDYHAGDTVCAGPEGKVCKMTREEIREWPDRIIGIVSEIPEYDTWGSGNVKVNNRIWIKVK